MVRNLKLRKKLCANCSSSSAAFTSWCCSWCWRPWPSVATPVPPTTPRRGCSHAPTRWSVACTDSLRASGIISRWGVKTGCCSRASRSSKSGWPNTKRPRPPSGWTAICRISASRNTASPPPRSWPTRSTGPRTSSRSTADTATGLWRRWPCCRPTARWRVTSSPARSVIRWRCRCSTPRSAPAANSRTPSITVRSTGTASTRMSWSSASFRNTPTRSPGRRS